MTLILQTTDEEVYGRLNYAISMTLSDLYGHLGYYKCLKWMYFTFSVSQKSYTKLRTSINNRNMT